MVGWDELSFCFRFQRGHFSLGRFNLCLRFLHGCFLDRLTFAVDDDLDFRDKVHRQADVAVNSPRLRMGCISTCCFLISKRTFS
jgi:hypothetical protein